MMRSTRSRNSRRNAAPNTNASRIRVNANPPPPPPRLPTPPSTPNPPASGPSLMQAGLRRAIRQAKDQEISRREIAPLRRSRLSNALASTTPPFSIPASTAGNHVTGVMTTGHTVVSSAAPVAATTTTPVVSGVASAVGVGALGGAHNVPGAVGSGSGAVGSVRGDVSGVRGVRGDVSGVRSNVSSVVGGVRNVPGEVGGARGDVARVAGGAHNVPGSGNGVRGDVRSVGGAVDGVRDDVRSVGRGIDGVCGDVQSARGGASNAHGGSLDGGESKHLPLVGADSGLFAGILLGIIFGVFAVPCLAFLLDEESLYKDTDSSCVDADELGDIGMNSGLGWLDYQPQGILWGICEISIFFHYNKNSSNPVVNYSDQHKLN